MGGLAGILRWDDRPVCEAEIHAMLTPIHHRGPDGLESDVRNSVGLGHARLALNPAERTESGIAWSRDGVHGIVADARLYNQRDLASQLGFSRDVSAARILLRGFRRWGPSLLNELDGDFAFAVVDRSTNSLFAARDLFAARPFFFAVTDSFLLFGSEPKQLLGGPVGISAEPDELEVARYVADLLLAGERTVWKGVKRLRAGHWLTATRDRSRQEAYWIPELDRDRCAWGRGECAAEVESELRSALRKRIDRSGPVAIELSGGYDSSTLALLAGELYSSGSLSDGTALTAVSAVYPGLDNDESAYIDAVADLLPYSARRFIAPLAHDGIDLRTELQRLDSPAVSVEIARDRLEAEIVRASGARVLITGFGGDDVFWEPDSAIAEFPFSRVLRLLWSRLCENPSLCIPSCRDSLLFYARSKIPRRAKMLYRFLSRGRLRERYSFLSRTYRNLLREESTDAIPYPIPDAFEPSQREVFGWLTAGRLHWNVEHREAVLSTSGVEPRHPYLNRRLAELVLSIPLQHRRPQCMRIKPLLRDAMSPRLPPIVLSRNNKATFDRYFVRVLQGWRSAPPPSTFDDIDYAARFFTTTMQDLLGDTGSLERASLWSKVRPIWVAVALDAWLRLGIADHGLKL